MKNVLNVLKKIVLTICVIAVMFSVLDFVMLRYEQYRFAKAFNDAAEYGDQLDAPMVYYDKNGNECDFDTWFRENVLSSKEAKAN